MATKQATAKEKSAKPAAKAPSAPTAQAAGHLASTKIALARRKVVVGTVVSDKMQKTIVVKVDRQVRHSLYSKYVTKSRRYKAHDENNAVKTGDVVSIEECAPISKDKRWKVVATHS